MAVLEGEWRRRERQREAEAASLRAEYAALEDGARQVVAATEERERRLVAAEEALARRRREAEREQQARAAEAEAAVRRLQVREPGGPRVLALPGSCCGAARCRRRCRCRASRRPLPAPRPPQVECEHQLAIERDRGAELGRQRAAAEQRAQAVQLQADEARAQLEALREAQRSSPAGLLQQQVEELRLELRRAEERGARALKAKGEYKQQVRRGRGERAGWLGPGAPAHLPARACGAVADDRDPCCAAFRWSSWCSSWRRSTGSSSSSSRLACSWPGRQAAGRPAAAPRS
jgi:centrosomal protein CEP120